MILMYFSNISDIELAQYHQKVETHFTRRLETITDETEPNLFKIEEITDTILKIYPMFYCDKITSSNPNDKIINNRCIICENDTNTRLNFITPTNDPIDIEDVGVTSGLLDTTGYTLYIFNPVFICYSKKDRRLLENVKVTANLKNTNDDVFFDEGYSNSDGLVYLPKLFTNSINSIDRGIITIEYDGVSKTIWEYYYDNQL